MNKEEKEEVVDKMKDSRWLAVLDGVKDALMFAKAKIKGLGRLDWFKKDDESISQKCDYCDNESIVRFIPDTEEHKDMILRACFEHWDNLVTDAQEYLDDNTVLKEDEEED